MQILFIFSLIFAILVSIFAVMNSESVTIKLLWKQLEFSQAIVILGSAAFGAVIVTFLGIFSRVKSGLKIRELQNQIKALEKEIEGLKPIEKPDIEVIKKENMDRDIKSIEVDIPVKEIKIENKEDSKEI